MASCHSCRSSSVSRCCCVCDDPTCLPHRIDEFGPNASLASGTQNLAHHFIKSCWGNRLRCVCIGIEEDWVFRASVSSEFLAEPSLLLNECRRHFIVQRYGFVC